MTFCFKWLKRGLGRDHLMTSLHQEIIVVDTSVLINFLRINRMDLIADHSHKFVITDHVTEEISDKFPAQKQRLKESLTLNAISQKCIDRPEELSLFGSLSATGRLGDGECSAIAMAVNRRFDLAIDDRQAKRQAKLTDPTLRILTTRDLMVSMIGEGILNVEQADQIKDEWATRHRFRLKKLKSFHDICS